jgi:triosephosphate isomerase
MRTPLLVANWKMHKDRGEARAWAESLLSALEEEPDEEAELVVAPPFTALETLATCLSGSRIRLAAQNVSSTEDGASTGEISARMLADIGCHYGIVGHSERRGLFSETSPVVAAKAAALLGAGLRPIVCVGESQAERNAGKTADIVGLQLETSLPPLETPAAAELVVAYEPIWAIGTGVTATPAQAQEVQGLLRERLSKMLGPGAEKVRVLYGGSVSPANIESLMAQPDIDGALIGGASLEPESFGKIVANSRLENSSQ